MYTFELFNHVGLEAFCVFSNFGNSRELSSQTTVDLKKAINKQAEELL